MEKLPLSAKNKKWELLKTFNLYLKKEKNMDIDFRVALVLLPLIAALSWAAFNIAPAALKQIQGFFNRQA